MKFSSGFTAAAHATAVAFIKTQVGVRLGPLQHDAIYGTAPRLLYNRPFTCAGTRKRKQHCKKLYAGRKESDVMNGL